MEKTYVEVIIPAESQGDLARKLLVSIFEGATVDELITLIQGSATAVLGMDLNRDQAYKKLVPILLVARFLEASGMRPIDTEPTPQRPEEERSKLQKLTFALSAVGIHVRMRAIHSCPRLMGVLLGKYESAVDGTEHSIQDLLEGMLGSEEIASDVVHMIEHIRTQRERDKDYLPDSEYMEFLRQVLFLINKLKIRDRMFCEFGKGILKDLRIFVGDYEEKMT